MAAGTLITVLSNIPWGQVLETAPKVAEGASRLWKAVANRKPPAAGDDRIKSPATGATSEQETLKARVAALEEGARSLHEQMQAATELIKALAQQNETLVQRVEANRVRSARQLVALALLGVAVLGLLIYLAVR